MLVRRGIVEPDTRSGHHQTGRVDDDALNSGLLDLRRTGQAKTNDQNESEACTHVRELASGRLPSKSLVQEASQSGASAGDRRSTLLTAGATDSVVAVYWNGSTSSPLTSSRSRWPGRRAF